MLTFELLQESERNIMFKYYPENGAKYGVVSYDKLDKGFSIVTLPENDRHKIYAQKMIARIQRDARKGQFKEKGTLAWY